MEAFRTRLGALPLILTCYQNGCVSIERAHNFHAIIDQPEIGIQAIIDDEGISVGANTEIEYGQMYEYKEMPELLSWLKAQNEGL